MMDPLCTRHVWLISLLMNRFGICLKIASHLHPFKCQQTDSNSDGGEMDLRTFKANGGGPEWRWLQLTADVTHRKTTRRRRGGDAVLGSALVHSSRNIQSGALGGKLQQIAGLPDPLGPSLVD